MIVLFNINLVFGYLFNVKLSFFLNYVYLLICCFFINYENNNNINLKVIYGFCYDFWLLIEVFGNLGLLVIKKKIFKLLVKILIVVILLVIWKGILRWIGMGCF